MSIGSGPPILFAHGFGTNQRMWRNIVRGFTDHRVILIDHIGWGDSRRGAYDPIRHGTIAGYADDLIEVAEELQIQGGVFVGHSIGTMIGLSVAMRAPHLFSRHVMIGASACYLNLGDYKGGFERSALESLLADLDLDQNAWADQVAALAIEDPESAHVALALADNLKIPDKAFLKSFATLTFFLDVREDLAKILEPVRILQTYQDPFVPLTAARYIADEMPNATLEMLNTKGHFPHETNPGAVIAAVRDFVAAR